MNDSVCPSSIEQPENQRVDGKPIRRIKARSRTSEEIAAKARSGNSSEIVGRLSAAARISSSIPPIRKRPKDRIQNIIEALTDVLGEEPQYKIAILL